MGNLFMFLFTVILLDVDECVIRMNVCGINAFCNNTNSSYECRCNIGYSGDGLTCVGMLCISIVGMLCIRVYKSRS